MDKEGYFTELLCIGHGVSDRKIISSMKVATVRIRSMVLPVQKFSRLDESDMKLVDIHQVIESTISDAVKTLIFNLFFTPK